MMEKMGIVCVGMIVLFCGGGMLSFVDDMVVGQEGYYDVMVVDHSDAPYRLKIGRVGWQYNYWIAAHPGDVEKYKRSMHLTVRLRFGGLSGHCYNSSVTVWQPGD